MASDQPISMLPVRTEASDSRWFRQVLGQYPTGVCIVTAPQADGPPAGLAVGSFTSVSLDPPLVAFMPDKASSSWPKIERVGKFCVNVLAADQEHVCRRLARKDQDKFAGLAWRPAGTGSPIIEGVVAWIDCDIEAVHEAGDHYIVLGRVRELQLEQPRLPLLFYQGGYGRFRPLSMAAADAADVGEHLRMTDLVRPHMEAVSAENSCQCVATALIDRELVVLANAGMVNTRAMPTLAGARLPFVPPLGSPWAAWGGDELCAVWLAEIEDTSKRAEYSARLEQMRQRGCSLGLLNPAHREFSLVLEQSASSQESAAMRSDFRQILQQLVYDPLELPSDAPESVRIVSVPAFGSDGALRLVLTLSGFRRPKDASDLERIMDCARAVGRDATATIQAHFKPGSPRGEIPASEGEHDRVA
jgi:flavin reductase (DIM6/NTAB) family NADH-FMN oxidoreductase RutF